MKVYTSINDLPDLGKHIVTFGSFDGLHLGHKKLLERIQQLAQEHDCKTTVITFHPHPRLLLDASNANIKLLSTIEEKKKGLDDLGIDNLIIAPFTLEFSQQHPREYIEKFVLEKIRPSGIVLGYDHRFGLHRQGDFSLFEQYEERFEFGIFQIDKKQIDENAVSSTSIRKSLSEGNIEQANRLLGYPYTLSGQVIKGDGIGRTLGYPTANLEILGSHKLIPQDGIYACLVELDGVSYESMLYIGHRPSIKKNDSKKVEVNIFDFDQNIYGRTLSIRFKSYIRGDATFDSMEALSNQLALDKIQTREYFDRPTYQKPSRKAAIAILNFNGVEYLEAYLPEVVRTIPDYCDIYVIDNGSGDESCKFIRDWFPEIHLVELSQNYGFAEGYNKGLEYVDAEFTVLLNSDVLVTDHWLEPIIEQMEQQDTIAAMMPKVLSLENKELFEYAGAAGGLLDPLGYPICKGRMFETCEVDEGQYDKGSEVFWASGAAMVVRTKIFKDFGGFDADYFAHQEEIDLCWRFKNAGYSCQVFPQSEIFHLGGGTLSYQDPYKVYLNFRNNLWTLLKNEKGSNLLWIIPIRLILDGAAGIFMLFKGQWKGTINVVSAHLNVYMSIGQIRKKRRQNKMLTEKYKVAFPNYNGRIRQWSIFQYFLFGKKKYSEL